MASRAHKLQTAPADERNTEANDNETAVAVSEQPTDQRELANLKMMLADAKVKSDREKTKDIVFTRGMTATRRKSRS